MTDADSAWLEYQVTMGDRLDLANLSRGDRELFRAIFTEGFNYGVKYERSF